MKHKELIKKTIESFCEKYNIAITEEYLYLGGLVIYESPITEDSIYNKVTLSFLKGFNCAMDWRMKKWK